MKKQKPCYHPHAARCKAHRDGQCTQPLVAMTAIPRCMGLSAKKSRKIVRYEKKQGWR